MYCSEFSIQLLEFVDGWCYVFALEIVDEVFIGIEGFFSDVFFGEEVGMGWSGGCFSLYNLVLLIVIRGFVCVVWDLDCLLGPVDSGVDSFQPGGTEDNIFISTIDNVEQDLVDDFFDLDEHGGDEFDDPCFVVRPVYIFGTDQFGEAVVWYLVSFNEVPIKAIDWCPAVNEGLGGDVFTESVFEYW